jgi:flavin reductase (DIM6/NTAB) family NADH-FMN oxidoreductase RutF
MASAVIHATSDQLNGRPRRYTSRSDIGSPGSGSLVAFCDASIASGSSRGALRRKLPQCRRQTDVLAPCRTVQVTIHHSHPFATGEQDRNPLRRFRGRMTSPVSIWAAADGGNRAGWTLSSFLVAEGDPGEVIGVIDEESALADLLAETATVTVNLLGWDQRNLADAFAGVAPAPGGPFALAAWTDTEWGPVLLNSLGWVGARLRPDPDHAGWGLLLRAVVERVEIQPGPTEDLLCYARGRYRSLTV